MEVTENDSNNGVERISSNDDTGFEIWIKRSY